MSVWKREEWDDGDNMKKWWSHCIVLQCFTQILCTFVSDLIALKVECSECLYERDRNEVMEKTWKSDGRIVLCCNPSPKYCAPSSPIWFQWRLSVVSVCMKETGMNGWWRNEVMIISLYYAAMLHPNIAQLYLRFDCC